MKNPVAPELSLDKYITIGILLAGGIIGAFVYFDGQYHVLRLFDWLDELGPWAPVLFILIDMLVVIFLLPGVMFTLGAGFMFGVLKGSLYVVIGTTLGATIAFMIARHLFGERVSRLVLSHSKLKLVDEEFGRQGWKIVLLTRLVPFFPFKLSNYVFGLMQISLRHFILGVFFGIWPITINNVYVGSLAADLATIGSRTASRSLAEWAVYGIGLIVTVGVVVYITRLARKALDDYGL